MAFVPGPSLVVFSGRGFHGYWLVAKPVRVRDDDDRARQVVQANRTLARRLDGDAVGDLARVMRMAGTTNPKTNTRCRLLVEDGPIYDFDVLVRALDVGACPAVSSTAASFSRLAVGVDGMASVSAPEKTRVPRGRGRPSLGATVAICGACLPGREPLSLVGCGRRKGATGDRVASTGHARIWRPLARWCGRVGRIRGSGLRFVVVTGWLVPAIASSRRSRPPSEPMTTSLVRLPTPAVLSNLAAGHRSDPAHKEHDRDRVHDLATRSVHGALRRNARTLGVQNRSPKTPQHGTGVGARLLLLRCSAAGATARPLFAGVAPGGSASHPNKNCSGVRREQSRRGVEGGEIKRRFHADGAKPEDEPVPEVGWRKNASCCLHSGNGIRSGSTGISNRFWAAARSSSTSTPKDVSPTARQC